jgi:hypothetical protein
MNYMDNLSYVRHYLKQKLTRAIPFWTSRNPQKPENPSFFFFSFFLSFNRRRRRDGSDTSRLCKPQSSPFHASKRHIHVRTALRRVPFRGIPKSADFFFNFDTFCLVSEKSQENWRDNLLQVANTVSVIFIGFSWTVRGLTIYWQDRLFFFLIILWRFGTDWSSTWL